MRFVDEDEVLVELETCTGSQGPAGKDGGTPYIGENGDWFIGDVDTGVKAQGPAGANGMGSGTVTDVKVGDATYEPDETGTVDLSGVQADDSSKLGGKAPEYYLQTINLLGNSDFEHWVAQAGIGGNHVTRAYAGDLWILDSGTVTGEKNANGEGYKNITLNGTIHQIVADPPSVGTAGIDMVSGTASITYANGEVTITSSGGVIKDAYLFKGAYTAGPLPPYVPKGYAAELAECVRYYQKGPKAFQTSASTSNRGTRYYVSIPMVSEMRCVPTPVITSINWVSGQGAEVTTGNLPSYTYSIYTSDERTMLIAIVFDSAPINIDTYHIIAIALNYELNADLF